MWVLTLRMEDTRVPIGSYPTVDAGAAGVIAQLDESSTAAASWMFRRAGNEYEWSFDGLVFTLCEEDEADSGKRTQ